MSKYIEFPSGKWTYKNTEGDIVGQHYIGYGSCDFICFYLHTAKSVELIREYRNRTTTTNFLTTIKS